MICILSLFRQRKSTEPQAVRAVVPTTYNLRKNMYIVSDFFLKKTSSRSFDTARSYEKLRNKPFSTNVCSNQSFQQKNQITK